MSPDKLRALVREIPDFPEAGILFKDITPLLLAPAALDAAVSHLAAFARPLGVELVIAAEARGFILGGALARELGAGFVPARKRGKLPSETVSVEYLLEYGVDVLEVHADAFADGARVLVHDDLLATGGTARGVCDLVSRPRRRGRRLRVPDRAELPRRTGAARPVPGPRRARVRVLMPFDSSFMPIRRSFARARADPPADRDAPGACGR